MSSDDDLPKPPNWTEPPSLEALVEQYGGWDRIPESAFREHEAKREAWIEMVRHGGLHRQGRGPRKRFK
ncbi:hypothetical protein [Bradyrhizobium sp. 604_D8_N2_3]|uniref:hypothetical protein n=1 Tax=Bradyrhizobium sp. 604_D8_N2_3 TaxID=3240370 RepID=UPI003F2898BB